MLNSIGIVDDEALHRTILKAMLQQDGVNVVIESASGKDFLHQLSFTDKLPRVCVVDIIMAGMCGYEVIAKIKSEWPQIKIIAYTGFVDKDAFTKAIDAGADILIPKSSHPKHMLRTIKGMLNDWDENYTYRSP